MTLPTLGNVAYASNVAKPWQSNGSEIDPNASIEEWQEQAGLNYEVIACPSMYDFQGELKKVPNRVQLVRSDTGESLSEMSATSYKIRQPREIVEFFRNLVENTDLSLEVMGTMQGGKKIFALAGRNGSEAEIGKGSGDLIKQNLTLLESFDGTHATKGKSGAMRFFCLNQISTGFCKGGVSRKHSQEFDIDGMQLELAALDESFAQYVMAANEMTKIRMTDGMAARFFARLYAPDAFVNAENWRRSSFDLNAEEISTQKRNTILSVLECMKDQAGGNLPTVEGTLYGALNAVTFYHDHEAGTRNNKRYESAMIGQGDKRKSDALNLALEVINA